MKTKYWAIVLCAVVLVLVMVACSQQASQEPQEPAQTAQTTEPVTTEPAKPPVETEPQEEPKQPEVTAPIEVKESDPVDEVMETVPPETKPAESSPIQVVPTANSGDGAGQPVQSAGVWDQAFYDTLTPEQQASYKNGDDSTRQQMQQFIEASRELEAQGYQGNWSRDQDANKEAWSQIQVGGGGATDTQPPSGGGTSDEEKAARRQQMVQESGGIGIDPSKRVNMDDPDEWDAFVEGIVSQLDQ